MNNKFLLLVAVSFLLSSCGAEEESVQQTERNSMQPEDTFLAPQLDALEKAKDVENKLQEAVDERDKKMRENGT